MRIAIGWDHRGPDLGRSLTDHLTGAGHEVEQHGPLHGEACDYPDVSWQVALAVSSRECDRGILICGTGIGASIAANKVPEVRAALVHDENTTELSRRHNDANVLCLAGDALSSEESCRLVELWLRTPFDGGRHERRVSKIEAL